MCVQNYSLLPEVRRRVFERIFMNLINNMSPNVFKVFFLKNMETLLSIMESHERLSTTSVAINRLCSLTDSLLDVEIVFNIFKAAVEILPKTEMTKSDSEVNRKFQSSSTQRDNKQLTLMKYLIQVGSNCKNEAPIQNDSLKTERRALHCAAYHCLATVIMNCLDKAEFYVSFLLDEKPSNQKYWLSQLVDTCDSFVFPDEVTSTDFVKTKRLSLRSRRKTDKNMGRLGSNLEANSTQLKSLSTHYLFESSLRDEVSQFDPMKFKTTSSEIDEQGDSDSVSTSEVAMEVDTEVAQSDQSESSLDNDVTDIVEDPVTTSPIFGTIVEIVKRVDKLSRGVETNPNSGQLNTPSNLPNWVLKFKNQLTKRDRNLNVSVFVAKVIITCETSFSPYSDVFLPELLHVLEWYLSTNRKITSFVVELVCLLSDWKQNLDSKTPQFFLEEDKKCCLNRIMTSMFNAAAHSNSALFKNNIELIKIMFENFKQSFVIDFDIIFDKLRGNLTETSPQLESAIQILGVIASNQMQVFPNISIPERCAMFKQLARFLLHQKVSVFGPVAESVGLILLYYFNRKHEASEKLLFDDLNKITLEILMSVKQSTFNKGSTTAVGKFITVFSLISDRFHNFGHEIADQAFFLLPSFTSKYKIYCLKVIYNHCLTQHNAFITLRDRGILSSLLSNLNESLQFQSLRVIEKMVSILTSAQLLQVTESVGDKLDDCIFADSKAKMYDIVIEVHKLIKHSSSSELYKLVNTILLKGLVESNDTVRFSVINYISKLDLLPESLPDRVESLFRCFYSANSSNHFLKYSTNIIFDLCAQSPDYNKEIFDVALDKCDFQQYDIENAWVNRHSGIVPMFVDTLPLSRITQSVSSTQMEGNDVNDLNVRATLGPNDLKFTATKLDRGVSQPSFPWLNEQSSASFGHSFSNITSNLPSTLLADINTDFKLHGNSRRSYSNAPQKVSSKSDETVGRYSSRNRVRLAVLAKREKSDDKSYFVKQAYDAVKERSRLKVESDLKKQHDVTVFRNYRIGEIPDIQIKNSDLIVPLLALVQNDSEVCSMLFVQLCRGVVRHLEDNSQSGNVSNSFFTNLSDSFNSILVQPKLSNNSLLVRSMITIALESPLKFTLDVSTLVDSSKQTSEELSSIAYLEKQILDNKQSLSVSDEAASCSKRRKIDPEDRSKSSSRDNDFALFKLFRSLGDYDNLMNCGVESYSDISQQIIKLELNGNLKRAVHLCQKSLTANKTSKDASKCDSELWKDVMAQCMISLCDWETLATVFDDEFKLEPTDGNCLSKTMDDYKDTIDAKFKCLLDDSSASADFCDFLEQITNDSFSRKEVCKQFPLNMSLVLLKQNYPFNATDVLRHHAIPQLQSSFMKLFSSNGMRVLSASEPCSQLRPISELLKFLTTCDVETNVDARKVQRAVDNLMSNNLDYNETYVTTWENVRFVHETCLKFLMEQFLSNPEMSSANQQEASQIGEYAQMKTLEFHLNFAIACVKQSKLELSDRILQSLNSGEGSLKNETQSLKWELANVEYLLKLSKIDENIKSVAGRFKESICSLLSFMSSSILRSHENFANVLFALSRGILALYSVSPQDSSNVIRSIVPIKNTFFEQSGNGSQVLLPCSVQPKDPIEACYEVLKTSCSFPLQRELIYSAESNYNLAKFCLNVLTADDNDTDLDKQSFEQYSSSLLTSTCEAMKNGKIESFALFPRLLNIVNDSRCNDVRTQFVDQVSKVPVWMFLGWVDQILSHMNEKVMQNALKPVILGIAREYPQALFFPYKISLENNKQVDQKFVREVASLVDNKVFEQILTELKNVALTPSAVLGDCIQEMTKVPSSKRAEVYVEFYQELFGVDANITSEDNEDNANNFASDVVNQSNFQRRLLKDFKKRVDEVCGKDGSKLRAKDLKSLKIELSKIKTNLAEIQCPKTLSECSLYLSNFAELHPYSSIEIPGQYHGESMPLVESHVCIGAFGNEIGIMESIRKPRRITIMGTDEKDYPFLLKGGEDLRQDGRLMKIFKLMNNFFVQNSDTKSRELFLQTYDVIPMTLKLGLIQWVPNTTTYQSFFEQRSGKTKLKEAKEHMHGVVNKFLQGKDFRTSFFLWTKMAKSFDAKNLIERASSILNVHSFRKAIECLSASPDCFIVLRDRFVRSYATMCISHYILGIGDRHTSNTLINLQKCTAVGIDFGHAFGTATQFLPVPELIPFRLTPMIANLTVPEASSSRGLFHVTMLKVLNVLKLNDDSLMTILQIFLREPVLDWIEFANRQASTMRRSGTTVEQYEKPPMTWYPHEKLGSVKMKLNGRNPVLLFEKELQLNSFVMKDCAALMRILTGDGAVDQRWSFRSKEMLSSEEQVTCLLDQAMDYKILGRTWIGWTPFA